MDLIDALAYMFPRTAARWLSGRAQYRAARQASRLYEAATSSDYRPARGGTHSADGVLDQAGATLRTMARYLDENHDLVVSVLDDLVNNTVGPGATVEPMIRDKSGNLATDTNDALRELWAEWADYPEVTGELGLPSVERLAARSLYRDGEVFALHVRSPAYRYQTPIPYALELLEADYCPIEYTDASKGIVHGIKRDGWRRPVVYTFYREHPGDYLAGTYNYNKNTIEIGADRVMHLKFTRRLHQTRGVTILHSVINRLRDLKDYEESERIAARVAAELTGFIQRSGEFAASPVSTAGKRDLRLSAGAIFELMPGESVGTISHNRPNTGLVDFRAAMLRAVAGGTGSRFSSIARDYNGTYSSQRQELVEASIAYRSLFAYLARSFYRPIWWQFVELANLTGKLRGANIDPATLYRVDFRAPALPWIDPAKEAAAWKTLIDAKLESRAEIMRQRGRDPSKVYDEIAEEQADGLFAGAVDAVGAGTSIESSTDDQAAA